MKTVLRFACAAVAAGMFSAVALAANTHVPTPSTWVFNVGQSDAGGGPSMKSDKMMITTDTDKWLRFTDVTVDGEGKTWKGSWSGAPDGTEKPLVGVAGEKVSFNAADDSSRWTAPDGSVSEGVMNLSSDKKKMTVKVKLHMKDGKEYNQTLVYDRVK